MNELFILLDYVATIKVLSVYKLSVFEVRVYSALLILALYLLRSSYARYLVYVAKSTLAQFVVLPRLILIQPTNDHALAYGMATFSRIMKSFI